MRRDKILSTESRTSILPCYWHSSRRTNVNYAVSNCAVHRSLLSPSAIGKWICPPPQPPQPNQFYHYENALFNRAYRYLVPRGVV
jgi:hypothetical protein